MATVVSKYEYIPSTNDIMFISYSEEVNTDYLGIKPLVFNETDFIKHYNQNSYVFYLSGDIPSFHEMKYQIRNLVYEVQDSLITQLIKELVKNGYKTKIILKNSQLGVPSKIIFIEDFHNSCEIEFSSVSGDDLSILKVNGKAFKRYDFSSELIDRQMIASIIPIDVFPIESNQYNEKNFATYFLNIKTNEIKRLSFMKDSETKVSSKNYEELLYKLSDNRLIFDYDDKTSESQVYFYIFNEINQSKIQYLKRFCRELSPSEYECEIHNQTIVNIHTSPELLITEKSTGKIMSVYFSKNDFNLLIAYDYRLSLKIAVHKVNYLKFNQHPEYYKDLAEDIVKDFDKIYTMPDERVNPIPPTGEQHSPESFKKEQILGVMMDDGTFYDKEMPSGSSAKSKLKQVIPEFKRAKDFDRTNVISIVDYQANAMFYFDKESNSFKTAIVGGDGQVNMLGVMNTIGVGLQMLWDFITKKYFSKK
jgi:hypothetical protein